MLLLTLTFSRLDIWTSRGSFTESLKILSLCILARHLEEKITKTKVIEGLDAKTYSKWQFSSDFYSYPNLAQFCKLTGNELNSITLVFFIWSDQALCLRNKLCKNTVSFTSETKLVERHRKPDLILKFV